ncbi:response regulator transcription factor [Cohnella terricola]|uniref:Response regulator n=1 Tax=Cohnella terricola TaxID=1289167 RepID=A0A559JT81_9BACL|nr:response regulator [Cohnella terricola]TVY03089.1 response regulator [Cohnella terricola]
MIKVLVVDDDHLVRRGFISMMPWSQHGMEVVGEASNGLKALEFLQEHSVDLLIVDLLMPIMSGMELMREVRKLYPSLHIVVLTFHQEFEYIQESLRLGAVDYITKLELENEQMDSVLERISQRVLEKTRDQTKPADQTSQSISDGIRDRKQTGLVHNDYSEEVSNAIVKAMEYIQNEIHHDLHLPAVAAKVGISRSYFSRCFKDIAGTNFNDYVRGLRIEKAKQLLMQSNRSIRWIASESGYPNEKYFCRIFREATGLLPSHYRKIEGRSSK